MSKILVTTYRRGGHRTDNRVHRSRERLGLVRDPDALPVRQGMLRRHVSGPTKYFGENLAPIFRFLRKRVDRPWNRVHAEICEHLDLGNTVQRHVLQHVFMAITFGVTRRPDGLFTREGKRLGVDTGWREFFVDDRGFLRRTPDHLRRRRRRREPASDVRPIDDRSECRLLDGHWFLIGYAPAFAGAWDILRRAPVTAAEAEAGGLYAASKRQLGRKELRALDLR